MATNEVTRNERKHSEWNKVVFNYFGINASDSRNNCFSWQGRMSGRVTTPSTIRDLRDLTRHRSEPWKQTRTVTELDGNQRYTCIFCSRCFRISWEMRVWFGFYLVFWCWNLSKCINKWPSDAGIILMSHIFCQNQKQMLMVLTSKYELHVTDDMVEVSLL